MKMIKVVYFSPTGGVEKVTKRLAEGLEGKKEYHNLMEKRIEKKLVIHDEETLVLAMPVFSGRIPEYCEGSIRHIHEEFNRVPSGTKRDQGYSVCHGRCRRKSTGQDRRCNDGR